MKTKLTIWDPAEHLDDDEAMALYLDAAFAEGDSTLIAAALGDIARAKGMSDIAQKTGLARESLYRSLSPEGNPEMRTILKVMDALNLKLHVSA
jgi:probable addiction module antidote protein